MKADINEKINSFLQDFFNNYTDLKKGFAKMSDDFILASNGMQYQNKVIDDMNAVVELFKIEKLDL